MNTYVEGVRLFHANWRVDTENTTACFLGFFEQAKNNYLLLESQVSSSEVHAQEELKVVSPLKMYIQMQKFRTEGTCTRMVLLTVLRENYRKSWEL